MGLTDDHNRGPGFQYFCPDGWTRCGVYVENPERMVGWNILYHGTSKEGVIGILESGMAQSKCRNGVKSDGQKAYFTPCIEYAAHPRYAKILPCPGGDGNLQVVLQCRVRPEAVQRPEYEATLLKDQRTTIHPDYDNARMEWITEIGPDNIIVNGVMIRKHPDPSKLQSSEWWSKCHGAFGEAPHFLPHNIRVATDDRMVLMEDSCTEYCTNQCIVS